jgi:hypothetical protein
MNSIINVSVHLSFEFATGLTVAKLQRISADYWYGVSE